MAENAEDIRRAAMAELMSVIREIYSNMTPMDVQALMGNVTHIVNFTEILKMDPEEIIGKMNDYRKAKEG